MYDLIIIGAGVSGLSAAIYSVSRGINTLVIEMDRPGGTLGKVSMVSHYAGIVDGETGETFSRRLEAQARSAGVEIRKEQVMETSLNDEVKKVKTNENEYEAKAVIIASGTTPNHLGVKGEDKLLGKGVSYEAASDGPVYMGKDVFVVGGSDGAMKEALYLSKFARQVTVIHFEDQISAIKEFLDEAEKRDNISFCLHSRLKEIIGEEEVKSIIIEDEHTKECQEILANRAGIFIYIGGHPNTSFFIGIDLENGFISTNDKMETNVKGVYAVGDIRNKLVKQAATAAADGAVAAIVAQNYIKSVNV